ncbi:hypothetical protein T03_14070 [Trichinella britovi]|uniref:Uncharacterized protein n=1 Tax=Trichinella britovi TaxID=45882 RepID=A0A0V1AJY8_TRIBR|nr:hypothetical protein T03_14070 [Trichinella britovi]
MDENFPPIYHHQTDIITQNSTALLRIQQKSLLPCEAESQKLNFVHRANLPLLCALRLR